jgi:hypothetical protein
VTRFCVRSAWLSVRDLGRKAMTRRSVRSCESYESYGRVRVSHKDMVYVLTRIRVKL